MLDKFPLRIIKQKSYASRLPHLSDEELVAYYKRSNDAEALSILLGRYTDVVAGMSINYLKNACDVDDFSQELYLKLSEKLKFSEIRNFRSWFLTTVKNFLIDTGRKDQTRLMHMEKLNSESSGLYEMAQEVAPRIEEVCNSFDILNENEKKCIEELYLKDKSYKEAMNENGWTFNELRGIRDRAINKLRKHFSKTRIKLEQGISTEK